MSLSKLESIRPRKNYEKLLFEGNSLANFKAMSFWEHLQVNLMFSNLRLYSKLQKICLPYKYIKGL